MFMKTLQGIDSNFYLNAKTALKKTQDQETFGVQYTFEELSDRTRLLLAQLSEPLMGKKFKEVGNLTFAIAMSMPIAQQRSPLWRY
jgi:hypothetical protein